MTDYDCTAFRAHSAELALGILPAEAHAAASAHLAGCPACRDHVQGDTLVADRLLTLFPANEPPIGFEQRVVARLGIEPVSRDDHPDGHPGGRRGRPGRAPERRWAGPGVRRAVAAAAAVLLVAAGVLGGVLLGRSGTAGPAGAPGGATGAAPGADPDAPGRPVGGLVSAALMSGGRQVGEVYAYTGAPSWVYMGLDLGATAGGAPVRCELVRRDGSAAVIGGFGLTAGRGYWGAPSPIPADSLVAARVLDAGGTVLAAAAFTGGR